MFYGMSQPGLYIFEKYMFALVLLGVNIIFTLGSFHSHWHTVVDFLNGLVVNSDGNLCISIEGKLNVVAATALPDLMPRQFHVFATSVNKISVFLTHQKMLASTKTCQMVGGLT